jgi:hypothetical protein
LASWVQIPTHTPTNVEEFRFLTFSIVPLDKYTHIYIIPNYAISDLHKPPTSTTTTTMKRMMMMMIMTMIAQTTGLYPNPDYTSIWPMWSIIITRTNTKDKKTKMDYKTV